MKMGKRNGKQPKSVSAFPTDEFPPLSTPQIREVRRRLQDVRDRTRFLLASKFSPTFLLYYDIAEDTYAMNALASATVFKRLKAASAIRKLLGRGIRIVKCRVDRKGVLVASSLPAEFRTRRRRRVK